MSRFEFATATRIVFGSGVLPEVGPLAKQFGGPALIVTGSNPHRAERLIQILKSSDIATSVFPVAGEPDVGTVETGVAQARQAGCGLVISFGGGSAIDPRKGIAAM